MQQAAFGGPVFSSEVDLWLEIDGRRVQLGQVAADYVITAHPTDCQPGPAEICVSVDGRIHRRAVKLLHGINPNNPRATVVPVDDTLPF